MHINTYVAVVLLYVRIYIHIYCGLFKFDKFAGDSKSFLLFYRIFDNFSKHTKYLKAAFYFLHAKNYVGYTTDAHTYSSNCSTITFNHFYMCVRACMAPQEIFKRSHYMLARYKSRVTPCMTIPSVVSPCVYSYIT